MCVICVVLLVTLAGCYGGDWKPRTTFDNKPLDENGNVIETKKNVETKPANAANDETELNADDEVQPVLTNPVVTIKTAKGVIEFELFMDKAPLTSKNFADLAAKGYYDNLTFHRVIRGFMIQGGDPKGDGTGGPGYMIKDEFGPGLKFDGEGVVAMANSGPNSGGSQFFITEAATSWLDGKHAIFGKVVKGMDVVKKIQTGDRMTKVVVE
jgi:cyclophilin family peptidyl-prolyl cis-trans isomerase